MLREPIHGQAGDGLERAWFLKEMGGSWDDDEMLVRRGDLPDRRLVHLKHRVILATDEEQRRRPDARKRPARQIRPAAARNHGRNALGAFRGGEQGSRGTVLTPK
jgi:hypothetical protein